MFKVSWHDMAIMTNDVSFSRHQNENKLNKNVFCSDKNVICIYVSVKKFSTTTAIPKGRKNVRIRQRLKSPNASSWIRPSNDL